MKYFLKEPKRTELVEALTKAGVDQEGAEGMVNVKDDLRMVDLVMTSHVLAISHCRNIGKEEEALKGLACISAFMAEAITRGLGEDDFPMSLAAIKDDLMERGVTTLQ